MKLYDGDNQPPELDEAEWLNVLDEGATLLLLFSLGVSAGLQDGIGLFGRPGLARLIPRVNKELKQLDRRKAARRHRQN